MDVIEKDTSFVFGETFADYSKRQTEEFISPLRRRLKANEIDLAKYISGKFCLDAGCGGGRGSILMSQEGASQIMAVDLSRKNLFTVQNNASLFGIKNIKTCEASLLELPFPDETFDFVWCNGVVHHTTAPHLALNEISRVLKVGGRMWLYIYGAGGIYWYMVDFIREWLGDVCKEYCLEHLKKIGWPADKVAEFMDNWKVPVLNRYGNKDICKALRQLGFSVKECLRWGVEYDTSHRGNKFNEQKWMGEGDLRYFARKRKIGERLGAEIPVFEDCYSPDVLSFRRQFNLLKGMAGEKKEVKIEVASILQGYLRDLLSQDRKLEVDKFRHLVISIEAALLLHNHLRDLLRDRVFDAYKFRRLVSLIIREGI
jgi:ubiquinone/menaquinone biosynthesis C-methylase UbiE